MKQYRPAFIALTSVFCALFWLHAFIPTAFAANEVADRQALVKRMGLQDYKPAVPLKDLKIAVLDNGFGGYQSGGPALPPSAELIEGPVNAQAATPHGLGMAQIVWAITGQRAEGPKFYLVNANGFSNFKAAVDFVIEHKVDIVLYSQVWPFGSNFDGKGFINAAVDRATSAGVLWVNAAGNDGGMVHNGRVQDEQDRAHGDGLRFTNKVDENAVTITLSWTDFTDDENYSTAKDLDLFVYDRAGKLVGSSELIQRGEAPASGDGRDPNDKRSSYARETVTFSNLDRGDYRIRIEDRSDNFAASDRFRVLIASDKPESLVFTDHSQGQEIMAPADNPHVLTVGEAKTTSATGPTFDGRRKPDILIEDATVGFSNGSETGGSSNAAALVAGTLATLKSYRPALDFTRVWAYADRLSRGRSNLAELRPVPPPQVPAWLWPVVPADGSVMQHPNGRYVVVTVQDPIELPSFRAAGARRAHPDDLLIASPAEARWAAVPASDSDRITAPWVEFRRKATGAAFWRTPSPRELQDL